MVENRESIDFTAVQGTGTASKVMANSSPVNMASKGKSAEPDGPGVEASGGGSNQREREAVVDGSPYSTPVRNAKERYIAVDDNNSEKASTAGTFPNSTDSRGNRRTPRPSIRKSLAWIRKDSLSEETSPSQASEKDGDTSLYKSFGEGLSRRRSVSQLDNMRSYALDIETTKANKEADGSPLNAKSKMPPHVIHPWTLSTETLTINQDAKIASYSNVEFLCNGKNSHIFKAKSGEEPVVIKKLFGSKADDPKCLHEFRFEVEFLVRAVSCESVVQVIESGHEETEISEEGAEGQGGGLVKKVTVPFIVLECLSGGSLTYKLTRKRSFGGRPFSNDVEVYNYMISLAEALHFLHYEFDASVHVIHRDLKPDNVAFTDDGRLKLIDFGLSICIKRFENAEDTYVMTGETGSLRYMAPEVISNKPYNCSADVFSFAIVSWEMCTGVVPHAGMSREKFIRHVVERKQRPGTLTDPYGVKIVQPEEMKELWRMCWDADMNKRWTMKKILDQLKEIRDVAEMKKGANSSCVCN